MDGISLCPLTVGTGPFDAPTDTASADRPDVLVVTGDPLVAHGVLRLLEQAGTIGSAEYHSSLASALTGPAVALVVVDPAVPDMTVKQVADLVASRQAKALLAVGMRDGRGLTALRSAGAHGLLTGAETPALCARMIALVLAGGSCWSADPILAMETADRPDDAHRDAFRLTPRQWQIAHELARGHSNKIIGHTLGISEGTVKIHVTTILRILGVPNRAAAVGRLIALPKPAA